jgi:AraC-like DNA-binding protein
MAGRISVTRFDTDIFKPHERHDAWRCRDWPAIGEIFETRPDPDFYNRSDRFALGPVSLHVAEMGAQTYRRTVPMARRDGIDSLIVEILCSGETAGDAAGSGTGNSVGGMVFDDLRQEHAHHSSETHTLLMTIPRLIAERNGFDVHALHGRRVSAARTALVRSTLVAIHQNLDDITVEQGGRLGQIVIDLIGVALDVDGVRAPASPADAQSTAQALAARHFIEERLGSPALSVALLCRHVGVSRSRLYRLFEAVGGVQAHIRERRLLRIQAILSAPGNRDRLADLADNWGFSDAAHLSRSFRERFGVTPSDYRNRR